VKPRTYHFAYVVGEIDGRPICVVAEVRSSWDESGRLMMTILQQRIFGLDA